MKYLKTVGAQLAGAGLTLVVAAAFMAAGTTPVQAAHESDADTVTINVMKHICVDSVDSVEDFENLDGPDEGSETNFHDKVLLCPTVVMPGDDYTENENSGAIVNFGDKLDFDFEIEDADGDIHNIDDAQFKNGQVTEETVGIDVNGDGDMNDSLDTSLYSYEGVASGDVTVTETDAPEGTRPGALEFTPNALAENNDADTLEEEMNEVFSDGDNMIELDTDADDDGVITLHVYNFQDDMGDDNDSDTERAELQNRVIQLQQQLIDLLVSLVNA